MRDVTGPVLLRRGLLAVTCAFLVAACTDENDTGPTGPTDSPTGPTSGGPTGPTGPTGSAQSRIVFAVDTANGLLSFDVQRPDQVIRRTTMTGLAAGEKVVGIDFRPADGKLYALGSGSRLYTVDTLTAIATLVGPVFTPALAGTSFGMDFNPTVDRVRVHSVLDQNLRLNPATGAVAAVDTDLEYSPGDAGIGSDPTVAGTAYTNSVSGATVTVLYAIDATRDALVTLANPNDGTMSTVGPLGVNTTTEVGFDIAGNNGVAYATLTSGLGAGGTGSTLFQVNLVTGAVVSLGNVSHTLPIVGIAIVP